MRNDYTDAEKAQIWIGLGVAGGFSARMVMRISDSETLRSVALVVFVVSIVSICYGVSRLAVSKGRSPAWGFAGVFGFLLLHYVLKPKPRVSSPLHSRRPPPPPPPGYVPTR